MIAIIDYGAGNTKSVSNALAGLNIEHVVTNDPLRIKKADKIIFPGVGEAAFAMNKLIKLDLVDIIKGYRKPLLGICLGMQLMFEKSEEGNVDGLSIFPGTVRKFDTSKYKIPHMGWNNISIIQEESLFNGIEQGTYFYFAHSFYAPVTGAATSISSYGIDFCSSVKLNNFYGVQFHPEKSAHKGLKLLTNFVELC